MSVGGGIHVVATSVTGIIMASVIRDLGGLAGEVSNAGECRGYVGTHVFKSFVKEPIRVGSLIGVEDFRGSLNIGFVPT